MWPCTSEQDPRLHRRARRHAASLAASFPALPGETPSRRQTHCRESELCQWPRRENRRVGGTFSSFCNGKRALVIQGGSTLDKEAGESVASSADVMYRQAVQDWGREDMVSAWHALSSSLDSPNLPPKSLISVTQTLRRAQHQRFGWPAGARRPGPSVKPLTNSSASVHLCPTQHDPALRRCHHLPQKSADPWKVAKGL